MSHNHTAVGKEKARKNLLHEAKIVSALGDNAVQCTATNGFYM